MEAPPPERSARASITPRALYLAIAYSALIALSPRLSLPRWVGVAGLGLGLVLLVLKPNETGASGFHASRLTPLQVLYGLIAAFPLCTLYVALELFLR
jgi:drug/metabolite transporter (DMT)-like permease